MHIGGGSLAAAGKENPKLLSKKAVQMHADALQYCGLSVNSAKCILSSYSSEIVWIIDC